eukprot:1160750-Pelagomonas_calceolata.AAC.8
MQAGAAWLATANPSFFWKPWPWSKNKWSPCGLNKAPKKPRLCHVLLAQGIDPGEHASLHLERMASNCRMPAVRCMRNIIHVSFSTPSVATPFPAASPLRREGGGQLSREWVSEPGSPASQGPKQPHACCQTQTRRRKTWWMRRARCARGLLAQLHCCGCACLWCVCVCVCVRARARAYEDACPPACPCTLLMSLTWWSHA